MTRTLAELVLLAALVVALGLIVASRSRVAPAEPGQGPAAAAFRDAPIDAGLPERAEALRRLLASPPPAAPVRRNPFGFAVAPTGAARAAALDAAAVPTPRPSMELAGIAEETGNGHPNRTAVISAAGQVIFAKEGDRVLSRFLVRPDRGGRGSPERRRGRRGVLPRAQIVRGGASGMPSRRFRPAIGLASDAGHGCFHSLR